METHDLTVEVARRYVRDARPELGEELYLKIEGFLRSRNIASLSTLSKLVDTHSHGVSFVRTILQIEAFFKKNASFSDDDICTSAARSTFFKSEELCRITNRRLDWYYVHRDRLDPDMDSYLSKMEKYVWRTLGPFNKFLEDLPQLARVTSGATSTDSRRDSQPHQKMKMRYRCPAAGSVYLRALSKFFGYREPRIVQSAVNRVEVVPKSWKTHRTIACEPDGALPFQLAFDTYCKFRLRYNNIDLRFQDRNQELARLGSIHGNYSTIDLSSASDTVAYNTVAWLLPGDWFQYLSAFRSTHFKGAFGYGSYSKFSSMGNGSTFAVETLVFSAACYATGSRGFSVYGDDIVIETEYTEPLLRILRFLGFKINHDKSYTTGPFRESCGSFWFKGQDVKPFFMRENARLKPELSHMINGLASVSRIGGELWNYLLRLIEENKLLIVPESLNSMSGVHIEAYHAYALKLIKRRHHIPVYRSYVTKSNVGRYIGNSQTLALWYLRRYQSHREPGFDDDPLICSKGTLFTKRYVRKWVCWVIPARQSPDHLYWWSEAVVRLLG